MPDINDLSERELEILRLVAGGASNKQIAHTLTISANTVKVHLRNIFTKIEVASRTEAAMFAVREGLVEPGGIYVGNEMNSQEDLSILNGDPATASGNQVDIKRWILIAMPFIIILAVSLAFIRGRGSEPPIETTSSPTANTIPTRWKDMTSMPTSRHGFAVAVFENHIYAIGGESINGVTGVVERFDPQTKSWETLRAKPNPVTDVNAAVIGGRIYVSGGTQPDGTVTDILEIYDPRQDTWEQGSPMPMAISAYAMVAFEGKLFVFGGENESGYHSTVLVYDPTRDGWDEVDPMPTRRAHAGAAIAGGKIHIIGGYDGQNALRVNEVFIPELIDSGENPWSDGKSLSEGRYKLGVTSVADIIYVFGGIGESGDPDITFKSISQNNDWMPIEVSVIEPWSSMAMVPLETKIYILGGQLSGEPTGSMLEYQAIYTILVPMVP